MVVTVENPVTDLKGDVGTFRVSLVFDRELGILQVLLELAKKLGPISKQVIHGCDSGGTSHIIK